MVVNLSLEQIKEGMVVFDINRKQIGRVAFIKYGNEDFDRTGPESATAGYEAPDNAERDSLFVDVMKAFAGTNDVPEEIRQNLLRTGYIKIERGFLKSDGFAMLNQISDVTEDGVYLTILQDHVPTL